LFTFSAIGNNNVLTASNILLNAGKTYTFPFTGSGNNEAAVTGNISPTPVPEPATWAMMLVGFAGIGMAVRRRRQPALAQVA
jgi:hypothetical protein